MRWGIIGLPQAGKTTLFQILTRTQPRESHRQGEQHIGVVKIPDERFDRLVKLFDSPKITHATAEFVDVAAISKETLKESTYLATLRTMDGLVHVTRYFQNAAVPNATDPPDPNRDIGDVEVELILSDLGVVENRLTKIEKDRKKIKSNDVEREQALLEKAKLWLEGGKPIREAEWTEQERKQLKGFSFLSEKPLLAVLNVDEARAGSIREIIEAEEEFAPWRKRTGLHLAAIAGTIEAELATLPDSDAPELMASYGLKELGSVRIVQAACELMGLITFFTLGDKECRAWLLPRGSTALQAAGTIHSDIEKHFIRAEVVGWEEFLAAGGWGAKIHGALRVEGKEYRVQDGEIINVRHSG